jgi:hypothetical protein
VVAEQLQIILVEPVVLVVVAVLQLELAAQEILRLHLHLKEIMAA